MARRKLVEPETPPVEEGGGMYFEELPEATEFIPTGSTLLDCNLGGGWALGRISNVYGDSATGKTLLGIEACANFVRRFPDGTPFYRERESAFDFDYAEQLGFNPDRVDFKGYEDGLDTVEDLFEDLTAAIVDLQKSKKPGFYGVDSLDAFPDDTELKNEDIRKVAEVAKKPRVMSQLFRRNVGGIAKSRMHLMFISQIRTKIGVTMGRKTERVGGISLRFYASQIVFLRQIEVLKHTVKGQDRPVGVKVSAKCEKNKKGMPYREVTFPILFGYGIDDLTSCVEFLRDTGDLKRLGVNTQKKGDAEQYIKETNALGDKDYADQMRDVRRVTREVWQHIEELTRERFLPGRRKYG